MNLEGLPTILISAVIGALVSYVGSMVSAAIESRRRIDESLHERRLESYRRIWQHTALIPKWPRATELTYEELHDLTGTLRDWYFTDGGMYLSHQARRAYGKVQKAFTGVAAKSGKVAKDDYDAVQRKCSALRTELTNDLLSRSRSLAMGAASPVHF